MTTKTTDQSRWLHIPIEIVERELYPKLFLASEAVRHGWRCVIGTKRAVLDAADQLPPGIMYLKSVIPSELVFMKRFKSHGHRLVSLDEEGLVQISLDILVHARYREDTVAETERFFCWGTVQCEALKKAYKPWADKFVVTGSPTADLWSLKGSGIYKKQAEALQKRFGQYILIPSSFGVPNHFMGPNEALKLMDRDNMFREQKDYDFFQRYHDYVGKVFHAFLKLLPRLAEEFPTHTIVLRPHPSEDASVWEEAAKGLSNVHVVFEGPISPWLVGAQAVLHWGSTTGIEAHLLGKPVIAFTPNPDEEAEFNVLPHLVSIMTDSAEEAFDTLHSVLGNPEDAIQNFPAVMDGHEELKQWIYNMDSTPAIENIMQALDKMDVEQQGFSGELKIAPQQIAPKEIIWKALHCLGSLPLLYDAYPQRIKIGLKSRAYGRHKTKDISKENIQSALKHLSDIPVHSKKLADNLFLIEPCP